MAQTRIVMNDAGVRNLLKGSEISGLVIEKAADIASRCGNGYVAAAPHSSASRTIVNIYPETAEARQDNYDNNTLKKELYK